MSRIPLPYSITARPRELVYLGIGIAVLLASAAVFFYVPTFAGRRVLKEFFLWLFILGLLVLFLRGHRLLRDSAADHDRTIFWFGLLFGLIAICIPPFNTEDIRAYVNLGWQQTHYGVNPYVQPVSSIPGWQSDPMFFEEWAHVPPVYGFLYARLAKVITDFGAGLTVTIALFKIVNLMVFLGAGWALRMGLRALSCAQANQAAYLFYWNPLVLLQILANVHTDLIMGLLMTLGLAGACAGGWLWVMPVLAASVFIKYASAVVMPFVFLFLVRRHGWGKAAISAGLATTVGFLCVVGYLQDGPLMSSVQDVTAPSNSLGSMLVYPFEVAAVCFSMAEPWHDNAIRLVTAFSTLAFLVCCIWMGWRRLRQPGYEVRELVHDCVLIQFVLVCLASPKFFGWYVIMFLPLPFWLPADDRLRRVILVIMLAQTLSFTFIGRAHFLSPLVMLVAPVVWVFRTELGRCRKASPVKDVPRKSRILPEAAPA